jgi:hypothetical protein
MDSAADQYAPTRLKQEGRAAAQFGTIDPAITCS